MQSYKLMIRTGIKYRAVKPLTCMQCTILQSHLDQAILGAKRM